jgi:pimeloyl-ACP methyl ester carboxylesterase
MSALETRTVVAKGHKVRVWEKGRGRKLVYLAGLAGVPHWSRFLEQLSQRHRVIVPSLPGFPGAPDYDHLDNLHDWIVATLDILDAAGVIGEDVVASSVGAMLALEVAAVSPGAFGQMALLAPLGLHDDDLPVPHIWARKSADMNALLCANVEALAQEQAAGPDDDAVEWNLMIARANAAAGRLLWPMCELGLAKRLYRIHQPALLVWGSADRIMAPAYSARFAEHLSGLVEQLSIEGAGHLIDIDAPEQAAAAVTEFMQEVLEDRRKRHAG